MKKFFGLVVVSMVLFLSSCQVQQFPVNTKIQPFENGGRVFGESKSGLKKGQDYQSYGNVYLLGINILNNTPTEELAKSLGAESYTIETKQNVLSITLRLFTSGFVSYTKTTVFKRTH